MAAPVVRENMMNITNDFMDLCKSRQTDRTALYTTALIEGS